MLIWNCWFVCLNKLLLHAYFDQHLVKTDSNWKAFNTSQQIITLAMQTSLLMHLAKYILNYLTELQILFFQYKKKTRTLFQYNLKRSIDELKVKYTKIIFFYKILFTIVIYCSSNTLHIHLLLLLFHPILSCLTCLHNLATNCFFLK